MAKLQITAIEGEHSGQMLEAQFNPKEIVVDRTVPWQPQLHKGPGDLEFASADPAHMSFELLFDGAESSKSIQPSIDRLSQFSSVDGLLHRPPKVKVAWGSAAGGMPAFTAVIESLSVRYAMFAENGVPLRATADVRLRQADHVRVDATPPASS
jgi:hypothetical protein